MGLLGANPAGRIPGPPEARPEWQLKGFRKVAALAPGAPQRASFVLGPRELSYWDDAPGASQWICAKGTFRACIGPNAIDAVAQGADAGGACTTFESPC